VVAEGVLERFNMTIVPPPAVRDHAVVEMREPFDEFLYPVPQFRPCRRHVDGGYRRPGN
jgi:hypothetical protein